MIKIESATLQDAYEKAAMHYGCSVTELQVEILQNPSSGFLGFFKKSAIIVASYKKVSQETQQQSQIQVATDAEQKPAFEEQKNQKSSTTIDSFKEESNPLKVQTQKKRTYISEQKILNDTILPTSFVTYQDDEYLEEELSAEEYKKQYINELDKNYFYDTVDEQTDEYGVDDIVATVKKDINNLFQSICFDIDAIEVKLYDDVTLLVEITGEDSALLIGKEGYRYKALSYMIFNWINSKYQMQLRLEIAEFLKNQEESVSRYLVGVCETIEREGRAQTKILDGVLVQIALKQLRETYPDKYVAIRSTRDGLKFIIINDYNGY